MNRRTLRHWATGSAFAVLSTGALAGNLNPANDPLLTGLYAGAVGLLNASSYGDVSAAGVVPCSSGCTNGIRASFSGGANDTSAAANASIYQEGTGKSNGSIPSGHVGNDVLSVLNASAVSNPLPGYASPNNGAAAISAAWDTLSFSGFTAGETATISLTLTLGTNPNGAAEGYGGGCISVGSACNPLHATGNLLTSAGQSETLTATFALTSSPVLIFDSLFAVADNNAGETAATIDPKLTITLPTGVTFTGASGNFGGTPVPLPGGAALFGGGLALLAAMGRRRFAHAA